MRTFSSTTFLSERAVEISCVGGSLSLGAVWTLSRELERRGVCFLFWMQGGVPGQFRMSPGMRWYSAVGLHTAQGISDKLRELTRQYFCRKGSLSLSRSLARSRALSLSFSLSLSLSHTMSHSLSFHSFHPHIHV